MTTNRHFVAAVDFVTVSDCDQLVVGPTHARGGNLDLLMTDVLDLERVDVLTPLGNSDHSSIGGYFDDSAVTSISLFQGFSETPF